MNDIIKLDTLSGEGIRAERKKEITNIQNIMDGVEGLQQQIRKFELEIQPAVDELKKQEAEALEAQEKLAKQKEQEEEKENKEKLAEQLRLREEALKERKNELRKSIEKSKKDEEDKVEQDDELNSSKIEAKEEESPWRRLKLEVNLSVSEKPQAYIITGNVPGMNQKDIKIKVDENKLIIAGFREPSQIDLQQMNRALTSRGFVPKNKTELLTELLKMGVGRFGTFQQIFQLPTDGSVDTSNIGAQYTNQILKIVIPKVIKPTQIYDHPQSQMFPGNRQRPQQRANRAFFQDPSVWW